MPGEVLKIRKSHGDTIVKYRAPDFYNFGERMEQIEKQYMDARFRRRDAEGTEEAVGAEETEKISGLFGKMVSNLMRRVENEIIELRESHPDAALQAKESLDELARLAEFPDELNDPDIDSAHEDTESGENDDNVHVIDIVLSDPLKWTNETQDRVDQFFAHWPSLRSEVLKAFFGSYREQYDDIWAFIGGHAADKIRFPDPTDPNVIENLFQFHSLHLSPDSDAIGLEGSCTWDDEHGVGAQFEAGALVEVGEADVAFRF